MKKIRRKRRSSWIDITFSITLIMLTMGAIYLISINLKDESATKPVDKKNAVPTPITIDTIDSNYPGIKIITETSNDLNHPFAIQYPQSVHKQFNEEITTYIEEAKDSYLQAMIKNNENGPKKRGELNISFETLSHQSGNYSFVLVTNRTTSGNRSRMEIRSFHLKPETGYQITFEDVFGNDVKGLEKVSRETRLQLHNDPALKNSLIKDVMIQKTTPVWENFKNFAVTDESLILYFDENELANATVGPPIVAIPLQDINGLLASDFKMKEVVQEESSKEEVHENSENNGSSGVKPPPAKSESSVEVTEQENDETEDKNEVESEKTDDTREEQTPTDKKVALTFDDGPDPKTTMQILATLKKYEAKATFFMLGSRVEYYPEIAKNVQQAGHELANHTWNHPDLTKANIEKVQKEINNTSAIIEKVTGQKATAFRPPYGAVNNTVRAQTDLPIVLWTVDTLDWKHRDPDKLLQNVKQHTKDGSTILMHDIHQSTADGLDAVLAYLQQEGYTFVTVSEMNS